MNYLQMMGQSGPIRRDSPDSPVSGVLFLFLVWFFTLFML